MQTPAISRLGKDLRILHRKSHSWRIAAARLRVLKDDGGPNEGLAYRIAIQGYMPTCEGLQRLIADGAIEKPEPRPIRLSEKQRLAIVRALESRKPLPPPTPQTIAAFHQWLAMKGVA